MSRTPPRKTPPRGMLKSHFQDRPLPISAITIHRAEHHAISGARLIIGQVEGSFTDKNNKTWTDAYITAWIPPGRINLTTYQLCHKPEIARSFFNILNRAKEPPQNGAFTRDWQQARTYAWENATIDSGTQQLSDDQIESVVKRISRDFNMAAPGLTVDIDPEGKRTTSYYFPAKHKILIRDRGLSFIVHEMAHAVDLHINKNMWSNHGPSFVRTLICLAQLYQWGDTKKLEESATERGLQIADLAALPALRAHMTRLRHRYQPGFNA